MKTGKLSLQEKFIIKGMLHEKKTTAEMAELLDRSEKSVQTYIDGELSDLAATIAKVQMKAAQEEVEEEVEILVPPDMYEEVAHKLKQAGLTHADACELIDRVIRKSTKSPANANMLYAVCVQSLNARDLMVTRAVHGRKGVAIMTKAASERGDENKKTATKKRASAKKTIFSAKTGEAIN